MPPTNISAVRNKKPDLKEKMSFTYEKNECMIAADVGQIGIMTDQLYFIFARQEIGLSVRVKGARHAPSTLLQRNLQPQ